MNDSRKLGKYIAGVLLMLFSTSLSAQDILDQYLQTAALNNPGLKAKFNEYMAALEVVPQVKALPDPQIAFGYFIQPVQTRTGPQEFKISASQVFPWFGTLAARENAAIQQAKTRYEVFMEARSDLFNQVRATYYNIYFNRKAIDITKENIEILNSFGQLARIKVEAALVSAVDVYRIEMESGDLNNQMALLTDQQSVLEVMFRNLLNVNNIEAIEVPDSLRMSGFNQTDQAALDSVMVNNHLLLALDMQAEALRYKRVEADKNGMPGFNIGLEYTFIGKGENSMSGSDGFMFPKVGLTVPLYRKKYKAMVQEAVYLEEGKISEKENRANILKTVFENGWRDYSDAHRRIILNQDQLMLARKTLELLATEYSTGDTKFEELLRMERKLLKYSLELEKAKADKQAAISFIYYLMGN